MSDRAMTPTTRQISKVALASIVGSVIEHFDFLVRGIIASTVGGDVFFSLPGGEAVSAAISVYGLGFIRPVGADIFVNLADRWGRKEALVYALVLMGVSTLLIGLTPGYAKLGIIAPILLTLFRLAQGIRFGAEVRHHLDLGGGASRTKYRALCGASVGFAVPIALLLGFGSVIFVRLSPQAFVSGGWRVLFFVGFLAAIVGIFTRTRAEDYIGPLVMILGGGGAARDPRHARDQKRQS